MMSDHEKSREQGEVQRKLIAIARAAAQSFRSSSAPTGMSMPTEAEVFLGDAGRQSRLGDLPPDSFTGYHILGELHEGGQGIVYLAFQHSTKRKVAIKVMKAGPFASQTDKARFDREVQILGQLKHPNIVAIHGTGMAAGRHYFVMDYIHGQPLDAFVASKKRSIREILTLFAKVAEAVSAAHLRGIIHRDLKPSNIRIEDSGEPHILDFGLAKTAPSEIELTAMTVTGQFLGSLPWASPEQAEGTPEKIDVRTDVYALGVMLYQMLTGRFPYEVVGPYQDVLNRILTAEPVRPTILRREIDDETETIVLKCLAKEPDRRYQTAGEFARDIRLYLQGDAIFAKRESTMYVLQKQLRKHRTAVGVVSLILATIAAALVVSATGWRQAASQRDAALEARAEAEAVTEFLSDMLSSGSPYAGQVQGVTVAEVLDRASQRLARSFPDRPLVRATIHDAIAIAYSTLRMPTKARAHSEASLGLRRELLPPDNLVLTQSLTSHAAVLTMFAEYGPAEELVREALDIRRHHLGFKHPAVAEPLRQLGHILSLRGKLDEAEKCYREALEQHLQFFGKEDVKTAYTMHFLAAALVDEGKHEEAQLLLRDAIAVRKQAFGENHPDVACSLSLLGESLAGHGNPQDALALLQAALNTRRALFAEESAEVANSLSTLCMVMVSLKKFDDAEPICRENLRVRRAVYGEHHPTMTYGLTGLGRLFVRWPRPMECEAPLREAVDILTQSQPDHWRLPYARSLLGACLAKQGRFEQAEPLLVENYPSIRAARGDDDLCTIEVREYLVDLYASWGRPEQAAEYKPMLSGK